MSTTAIDTSSFDATRKKSAAMAVALNFIPVAGVLFLNWNVGWFMFLYWMENIVVGLFNAVKIAMCRGSVPVPESTGDPVADQAINTFTRTANVGLRIFLVPFFIVHYGAFCAGHGVFVFALFGEFITGSPVGGEAGIIQVAHRLLSPDVFLMLAPLALLQAHQFKSRFIDTGEYKTKAPNNMMVEPYGRIVVLHVSILFAAFLFLPFGANKFTAIILILFKTTLDIILNHRAWKAISKANEGAAAVEELSQE